MDIKNFKLAIDYMGKSVKKIKSILYTLLLLLGLAVMISPLPEGTVILSLILSYFGYKLTGNIYITIATYLVTFIITIILIKKLNLINRFKVKLRTIRAVKRNDEKKGVNDH